MPRTKPVVSLTSSITRYVGALIADHVRDDVIAALLDAVQTLAGRGCTNLGFHVYDGLNISRMSNAWKTYERGFVAVGGICGDHHRHREDGRRSICLHVSWRVDADLVGIDWDEAHEVLSDGW